MAFSQYLNCKRLKLKYEQNKRFNKFLYLEEVGVDKRDREELGVSDLGSAPVELFPRELCTGLFPLEFAEVTDIGVSSSKSIRRCVFERRLELARPVMISFDEFFCVSLIFSHHKMFSFHYLSCFLSYAGKISKLYFL